MRAGSVARIAAYTTLPEQTGPHDAALVSEANQCYNLRCCSVRSA